MMKVPGYRLFGALVRSRANLATFIKIGVSYWTAHIYPALGVQVWTNTALAGIAVIAIKGSGGNAMAELLANEFSEILPVLLQNEKLRAAVVALIADQGMAGKVTEGSDRLKRFRLVLTDLVNGKLNLNEAALRTGCELPQHTSTHADNHRVFSDGWEERLVWTQLSRFYNQAVMEQLRREGETQCFIPHSEAEAADSPCSQQLAGANHDLRTLYGRLVDSYARGNWTQAVKVPNHAHCTHVVTRVRR